MQSLPAQNDVHRADTLAAPAHAPFAEFASHRHLVLRSFRRNGTPVDTPVWFALASEKIFIFTETTSGKAKRIRNRATVEIAPSSPTGKLRGAFRGAVARILPAGEASDAQRLLHTRYGWMISTFERWWRWRGRDHVYLELTPRGAPGTDD